MPTYGEAALAVAITQLGIKEDPPGSNWGPPSKYIQPLGHGPEAWCADFVEWCLEQADWPRGTWNVSYVPSWVSAAQGGMAGMCVTDSPQTGDLVTYDWEHDGIADHIGIYEKPNGANAFDAIEGNTSPTSDSNGGEVMRRTRTRDQVKAFIRLPQMPKPTLSDRLANAGYGEKTIPVILHNLSAGIFGTKPNPNDSKMFRNLRDAGIGATNARKIVKSLRRP